MTARPLAFTVEITGRHVFDGKEEHYIKYFQLLCNGQVVAKEAVDSPNVTLDHAENWAAEKLHDLFEAAS